jgi:hypothetical protein
MKRLGVLGLGRLAEFYIRDLISLKLKPIILKNSNYISSLKKSELINKKYKLNVKAARSYKIFFQEKFDTVLICSPSKFHFYHLKKALKNKRDVIVEKPIISLCKQQIKKKNISKLEEILNYDNKIYYNLVNEYYAKKYLILYSKKKFNYKRFDFVFHTNGIHKYDKIMDDLLPHMFSVLNNLINYKKLHSIKKKINKNKCYIKFYADNCLCHVVFKQNCKKKVLKFGIDKYIAEREMFEKKDNVFTYLVLKKIDKKVIIKNPLTESVKVIYNNSKNYNSKIEKNKIMKNFKDCCEIFYAK